MSVALKVRPSVSSSPVVLETPSVSKLLVDVVSTWLVKKIADDITKRQTALDDPTKVWTRRERLRAEKGLACAYKQLEFTVRTMS